MKKLEELKLRDNTIVILQSDHGHSTEDRTFGGGGNAGPLRGAKFSLFEGGIRVPAIISWKGKLPQNEVRSQTSFNVDWFPTIAELCGITIPRPVEGKSLVPVLRDKKAAPVHDIFYWRTGESWAIRKNNWKLLGNPNDTSNKGKLDPVNDKLFLVNMAEDSTEMVNLASKYPDKVQELVADYNRWEYSGVKKN